MTEELKSIAMDSLDVTANEVFPGLVVRKDLLRLVRSAYSVPMFVIEFLLGKYCASMDQDVVQEGLEYVRETLRSKYVKPDERELIKSRVKEQTSLQVIDKVRVRLVETQDKYWAELMNVNLDYVNIDSAEVRKHERLLQGGVWAEITLGYDEELIFGHQVRPFFIQRLRPIQVSSLSTDAYREARSRFTRDEWMTLLIRTLGMEADHPYFTPRRKLLYLTRLIPLVEKNYNLVELGPRGTGKSFAFQQLSPYSHLISGGQTTVPQMFVNLASGQRGLVCLWDVVAFDEVAGIRFSEKNGVSILKGYMEDGTFSRGSDIITAEGSIVLLGNIDGDVQSILKTTHLFYPMPREMDMAFYDRLHAYLPGWELEKTRDDYYTSHFGLVSDYFAEILRAQRRDSYVDVAERYVQFGSQFTGRDQKAVRKTVSGLVKLLHPTGEVTRDEVLEYVDLAIELRRRVKEQLKRMGGMEYWDVDLSYTDIESGAEAVVPVPEMRAPRPHLPETPLVGEVIGLAVSGEMGMLQRFEMQRTKGNGRIMQLGSMRTVMRESVSAATQYIRSHYRELDLPQDWSEDYNVTVLATEMAIPKDGPSAGVTMVTGIVSALKVVPVRQDLAMTGEITIMGKVLPVGGVTAKVMAAYEAGLKTVILPRANQADTAQLPPSVAAQLNLIYVDDVAQVLDVALVKDS